MKGMVSNVFLENGIIKKVYLTEAKYQNRPIESHWTNEVRILTLLKGKKHFPQIIKIDGKIIWMTYCGESLTKKNLPKDWQKQCKQIERTLNGIKIFHMDLVGADGKTKNLCVKDNIIYLIDWGMFAPKKQDGFRTPTEAVKMLT